MGVRNAAYTYKCWAHNIVVTKIKSLTFVNIYSSKSEIALEIPIKEMKERKIWLFVNVILWHGRMAR